MAKPDPDTPRNRAEAALRQRDDHLQLVIDTTPALIHSGLPDGSLDYFNQRWLEYLGVRLEDVQGWKWTSSLHRDDVVTVVEKWRSAVATGEPFEAEGRMRRADGEYRWFLHRLVPLRDDHGRVVKWFGSSVDIEDRKRVEEALRESQANLAEAQRVAAIGSWSFDVARGRITGSEELYRIYRISEADFAGTPFETFFSLIHPEDRQSALQDHQASVTKGLAFNNEYRILFPDGEVKTITGVGYVSKDSEGNVVRVFGTVQDTTRRKLTEKALRESQQRLSQLLEDRERMSRDLHDNIIQMLYAIGLGLEESQRLLEEDAKAASSNLSHAIKELNAVIRDVRSYIAWSEPTISNGRELISAIERLARTMEGTHRLHFRLQVDPEAADRLTPEEARHVLDIAREAMSNSLRHSQAHDGLVVLEVRDGSIALVVADFGVGFDPGDTGRYGQGLCNMASRAQNMNARLQIVSEPGLGVKIILDIPMIRQ